jgi:ubiquinone/menaquinone biosynthesis C-methylase UbiE
MNQPNLSMTSTRMNPPQNRSHASSKPYKGPAMEGFIATWYANNTKGEIRGYRVCAESVACRVPPGGNVLELAPGPGYLAIELAKLGDYRISGLDISHSFVRIASENARAAGVSIDFQQGNASEMPYPDASFDFVVCRAAFKNFADPAGAIDEIYRVLKPGGKASIYDLRKESSKEEIRTLVDGMQLSAMSSLWTKLTFRFFLLKNAYTKEAIEQLAAESRFGGCEVIENGIEFDLRLHKP